jgi:hypothetical protein
MKCIKAIKETSQYEVGRIARVEDKVADQRVSTGNWKFISKSEWKEGGRVAPIITEVKKKVKAEVNQKKNKKKK